MDAISDFFGNIGDAVSNFFGNIADWMNEISMAQESMRLLQL
jgi:hypothetical protein